MMENDIDQLLVGGPSILQSEWYHAVVVGTSVGNVGCMLLIGRVHQDLVVPRESIHEAEHLMIGCGVDQLIYAGKRIAVFGTSSV